MRKLFRFISLAMVSALTLSMFSCGEDAPEPIPEKTGVFRAEEIIPPDDYIFNDYADIGWSNGYFTIEGRTKLDPEHPEKDQERVLLKVAEDGTQTVEFSVLALNGTIKMYTRKLDDGKTISVEGTFDTDHYADVKLIVRDKKDKVTSEHALNDIFGIKIEDMTFDPMSASITFYPRFADERDGVIYVVTTIGAAKIDGDNISTIMSRQQIRSSAYGSDGIVVVTDDRNGNIKRADFDAGEFVQSWDDDAARKGYCLYKMGCKGPTTYNACSSTRWNDGVSFPIQSGHGCLGCAENGFWDRGSFYSRVVDIPQMGTHSTADTVGLTALGVVAAAVGVHAVASAVDQRRRHNQQPTETEHQPGNEDKQA